jgi:hypothetical protein
VVVLVLESDGSCNILTKGEGLDALVHSSVVDTLTLYLVAESDAGLVI